MPKFWQNMEFIAISQIVFEFSFVHCIDQIGTKNLAHSTIFPKIVSREFFAYQFGKLGIFRMLSTVLSIFIWRPLHNDHVRNNKVCCTIRRLFPLIVIETQCIDFQNDHFWRLILAKHGVFWIPLNFLKNFHSCTVIDHDWDQKRGPCKDHFFKKLSSRDSVLTVKVIIFDANFGKTRKFSEYLWMFFQFSFVHCITIILVTEIVVVFRPPFHEIVIETQCIDCQNDHFSCLNWQNIEIILDSSELSLNFHSCTMHRSDWDQKQLLYHSTIVSKKLSSRDSV